MSHSYFNDDERCQRCIKGGWYLCGDVAKCDKDGYYRFVGCADDMIKSAGHLVGLFEVDRVLLTHPAGTDAAVIGVLDTLLHEMVKGYVRLKLSHAGNEPLKRALLAHARKRLGSSIAPREIEILDTLPRNQSGKITRRLLRARELGLQSDDISTF